MRKQGFEELVEFEGVGEKTDDVEESQILSRLRYESILS